ncbi:MAG: type 1 periplasmic-binding domain-containing protein, partial [Acidimicrobiales bacterium]
MMVGIAGVVIMALLAWIAVPSATHTTNVSAFGGLSPQPNGQESTTPANGHSGGGSSPSGGPFGAGSVSPGGTGTGAGGGVSASSPGTGGSTSGGTSNAGTGGGGTGGGGTGGAGCSGPLVPLKIGVVIPDIGSGSASVNSTFGLPSASEEQADYAAVFDSINKAGGVRCHSLVGDYQVFNETDSTAPQSECIQFNSDKVFAVLGGWLPTANDNCALADHIPVLEQVPVSGPAVKQYYPYALSVDGELDLIDHNFAHAVANMGYFSASKGFKKVGIFYRDCIAGEYQTMVAQLESVGVPASAITSADIGCPFVPFAPPQDVEQAVLQFQSAGVTDVIPMNEYEDLQAFTRDANAQGYKPQYLVADDGIVATSGSPSFAPTASNFDKAVAITPSQYGAIQSGLPETAATKQCDQIMTSHRLPTV